MSAPRIVPVFGLVEERVQTFLNPWANLQFTVSDDDQLD
jgi:hypothetical protein